MGALRENPSGSQVSVLTARAIELEAAFRNGVLPRAGGWDDQEENDIILIRRASHARVIREVAEAKKRESRRGMFRGKRK